jgi:hypothetical protein
MSNENGEFKVEDKRFFDESGELRGDDQPKEAAQSQEEAPSEKGEAQARDSESAQASSAPPLPPDFASFIVSLSHAAVFHLGQAPDPQTGQTRQDLPMARHTIDTIAMLKEKTQGNLSNEEQQLIDNVLTDLRLAYVHLAKQ